jgi:hypothetical protein
LDEEVPKRGGFYRASDDRPLAGISGELVENIALGTTSDYMDYFDAIAG